MNVLEKILEEISERIEKLNKADNICKANAERNRSFDSVNYFQSLMFATERAESIIGDIIRSHMDEIPNCEGCSRRKWYQKGFEDGKKDNDWISVEEKLPEVGEIVEVTVHSSEWIADYSSGWVPEEEKTYHAEEHNVYYGYLNRERQWVFYDNENSENICEKEFGTDKGRVYDVVTAWRLKTEPYKEEKIDGQFK